MIQLTEKAITKIKEIAESEGLQLSIRVKVKGGSCAGFVNDMEFDEITTDLDEIFEQDGIKVIIDPMSLQYLEGAVVDYIESEFQAGFTIKSPQEKGSCGCGKSVSY
jgi:iron-sulfur cluster insertion protein